MYKLKDAVTVEQLLGLFKELLKIPDSEYQKLLEQKSDLAELFEFISIE